MNLRTIIRIASSAYPDDLILTWHDGNDDVQDMLAKILAEELKAAWDRNAPTSTQLETAVKTIQRVEDEVSAVKLKLAKALQRTREKGEAEHHARS